MARYSIDGGILDDIANAINSKTGDTEPLFPQKMAGQIDAMHTYDENDVGSVIRLDAGNQLVLAPLPTLTHPATSSDIRLDKEALDGNGDVITGTMDAYEAERWYADDLSTFPASRVLNTIGGGGKYYGSLTATLSLAGSAAEYTVPVQAWRYNGTLYLSCGASDGFQSMVLLLTGSGTGLTCAVFYNISGGVLTDLTSMADQLLSDLTLMLCI